MALRASRQQLAVGLFLGIGTIAATGQAQGPASPQASGRSVVSAESPAPSPASIERAAQILAATRQALGGEKLTGIRTLTVTGRTRRVRGNNLVPIEFEISYELPDRFLRRDESPFEESDPTSVGFNGDDLVQIPAPAAANAPVAGRVGGAGSAPPPSPEQQAAQAAAQRRARVTTIKQDFVRMMLGIFPDSLAAFPLTFAHAAVAEAPQGKADVLDVRGSGNFLLRLLINSQTRQPIMVSWSLPPSNVIVTAPGQPSPATVAPGAVVVVGPPLPAADATAEQKDAYAKEVQGIRAKAQATPIEHRLYYADYRDVDGVLLPFRFRRAIGADTTEETTVDRYRINAKISPERFRPVK